MNALRESRLLAAPVKVSTTASQPKLSGYAAIFGSPTTIAGEFREQIARGAFAAAIGRDDCRCLWNHNRDFVLGRTKSRTLRLTEDAKGLRYEVDVPDTQWARDLMVSITRGDVSQSSFGFEVTEDDWTYGASRGALPLRTIKAVRLVDVSPVSFPAYEDTTVAARDSDAPWQVQLQHARERLRIALIA